MVATDGQHCGVPDATLDENGHVRGAPADVGQDHAHLPLVVRQSRLPRSQRRQNELVYFDAHLVDTLGQVVYGFLSGRFMWLGMAPVAYLLRLGMAPVTYILRTVVDMRNRQRRRLE